MALTRILALIDTLVYGFIAFTYFFAPQQVYGMYFPQRGATGIGAEQTLLLFRLLGGMAGVYALSSFGGVIWGGRSHAVLMIVSHAFLFSVFASLLHLDMHVPAGASTDGIQLVCGFHLLMAAFSAIAFITGGSSTVSKAATVGSAAAKVVSAAASAVTSSGKGDKDKDKDSSKDGSKKDK